MGFLSWLFGVRNDPGIYYAKELALSRVMSSEPEIKELRPGDEFFVFSRTDGLPENCYSRSEMRALAPFQKVAPERYVVGSDGLSHRDAAFIGTVAPLAQNGAPVVQISNARSDVFLRG
jgi:hypothetical protein